MRVTKFGECGILCALHLARHYGENAVGAAEIAESQGIDLQYTQQILQRLRKGEVIESVRGPKGGYRLQRTPDRVTLREILYATEGETFQIICDHAPIRPARDVPDQCSTKESCGLHGVWQELRAAIDKLLEEKTLADLMRLEPPSLVQIETHPRPTPPSQ